MNISSGSWGNLICFQRLRRSGRQLHRRPHIMPILGAKIFSCQYQYFRLRLRYSPGVGSVKKKRGWRRNKNLRRVKWVEWLWQPCDARPASSTRSSPTCPSTHDHRSLTWLCSPHATISTLCTFINNKNELLAMVTRRTKHSQLEGARYRVHISANSCRLHRQTNRQTDRHTHTHGQINQSHNLLQFTSFHWRGQKCCKTLNISSTSNARWR